VTSYLLFSEGKGAIGRRRVVLSSFEVDEKVALNNLLISKLRAVGKSQLLPAELDRSGWADEGVWSSVRPERSIEHLLDREGTL
jgi:hypothetical protein